MESKIEKKIKREFSDKENSSDDIIQSSIEVVEEKVSTLYYIIY